MIWFFSGEPTTVTRYMEYFKAEETQDGIAVAVLEKTFFNAEDFFRGAYIFISTISVKRLHLSVPGIN